MCPVSIRITPFLEDHMRITKHVPYVTSLLYNIA